MHKHAKWTIAAVVSWTLFFIVLFGGVIPKTAFIREYPCTIEHFAVDPRFECDTRCPIMGKDLSLDILFVKEEFFSFLGKKPEPRLPTCSQLKQETLQWYNPGLCLAAPRHHEDPLCPPEAAVCLANRDRKCMLECPLAYNISITLNVDKIGRIEKSRDLGKDRDRYLSYKNEYAAGKRTTCQVVSAGENKRDVRWVDERLSKTAFAWWKWGLFTGTMLSALVCTVGAILRYTQFRQNGGIDSSDYDAVDPEESDSYRGLSRERTFGVGANGARIRNVGTGSSE